VQRCKYRIESRSRRCDADPRALRARSIYPDDHRLAHHREAPSDLSAQHAKDFPALERREPDRFHLDDIRHQRYMYANFSGQALSCHVALIKVDRDTCGRPPKENARDHFIFLACEAANASRRQWKRRG
jgi:hypothetical protein